MKEGLCVIIILNLNGKEYLGNCLNSIKKNTSYKNYKILVVDNGSVDGSQKMIRQKFVGVDLIENKTNRGFFGGNNDGVLYFLPRMVLDCFREIRAHGVFGIRKLIISYAEGFRLMRNRSNL